ncbi:hypothetical protein RvY_13507 [Ramazzottius varieornatus]|uniref:Uncharacterized protein n=1 Tax=Ramazzottius varieornatus TaxID=947166 RepID=A0A1D1VN42_RAMVA|nr:hypothetical protein RvY_13507 [Ramazzottius varieornatus]
MEAVDALTTTANNTIGPIRTEAMLRQSRSHYGYSTVELVPILLPRAPTQRTHRRLSEAVPD